MVAGVCRGSPSGAPTYLRYGALSHHAVVCLLRRGRLQALADVALKRIADSFSEDYWKASRAGPRRLLHRAAQRTLAVPPYACTQLAGCA